MPREEILPEFGKFSYSRSLEPIRHADVPQPADLAGRNTALPPRRAPVRAAPVPM